jgi:hypothetical protein
VRLPFLSPPSYPLSSSSSLTLTSPTLRFVFKNPKKLKSASDGSGIVGAKGASAMQPAASALEGVKLVKGEVGRIGVEAVNERKWGDVKEEKVGVDEVSGYSFWFGGSCSSVSRVVFPAFLDGRMFAWTTPSTWFTTTPFTFAGRHGFRLAFL